VHHWFKEKEHREKHVLRDDNNNNRPIKLEICATEK
jgi:hypothetical protein